jgi:hypothetical protein
VWAVPHDGPHVLSGYGIPPLLPADAAGGPEISVTGSADPYAT